MVAGLELQARFRPPPVGTAGCISAGRGRKQDLGRESSRRAISWHNCCGVFIVRLHNWFPFKCGVSVPVLLGRLQPGPRKAANHSRGSPLLGKLGCGSGSAPNTSCLEKFGALQVPLTLPVPQPKECIEQQKVCGGAHVPFWISPMSSHICAHPTSTAISCFLLR